MRMQLGFWRATARRLTSRYRKRPRSQGRSRVTRQMNGRLALHRVSDQPQALPYASLALAAPQSSAPKMLLGSSMFCGM
jgi:hypothetical protein